MERLLAFILGLALLYSGCDRTNTKDRDIQKEEAILSGQTVANLGEAPGFQKKSIGGRTIRLSDYQGQVVVLNFWATWCAPCRREIPALMELHEEYKGRMTIIGFALDEEGNEVVRPYAEAMNINYPVVLDDYSYGDKLGGIFMVPTTFIIDQAGIITARRIGEISKDDIANRIERLLTN